MGDIHNGLFGPSAVQHVAMEFNSVIAHAQIHLLQMVVDCVRAQVRKPDFVLT